jgi:hypothetical protein
MVLSERIQERVEKLPARLQTQVLDFVEYLLSKAEREALAAWLIGSQNHKTTLDHPRSTWSLARRA